MKLFMRLPTKVVTMQYILATHIMGSDMMLGLVSVFLEWENREDACKQREVFSVSSIED